MRVAIVGGGISGLAAAWCLGAEHAVTVLEGAPVLGGKLRTVELAGIAVDAGAESMLNRRPEAVDLVRAVGWSDRLRYPETTTAALAAGGALRAMPTGTFLGIPTDRQVLHHMRESGLLSPDGFTRALRDLAPPDAGSDPEDADPNQADPNQADPNQADPNQADPNQADPNWADPGDDEAIGALVARRLGREPVDRLLEPLLGGVYAGHADRLSVRATAPQLARHLPGERSLIRAAAKAAGGNEGRNEGRNESSGAQQGDGAPRAAPVFAGLDGGIGALPSAVADAVSRRRGPVTIRTGAMVRELHRTPDGWRLVIGPTAAPSELTADAVILACPAGPAARLLAGVLPHAAAELAAVEYASVATVSLAFRRREPDSSRGSEPGGTGSGFLVAPVEGRLIKAATYATNKWGWLADRDPGLAIVRCSVGRHGEEADLQRPDSELIDRAVADLRAITGAAVDPGGLVDARLTRWGGALPQYAVGHAERIARARAAVTTQPGLALAGAALDGVGIAACVASAEAAVARLHAMASDRRPDGDLPVSDHDKMRS